MASPELVVSVQDASQAVRPVSHPSNVRGFPELAKQIALNVFEGLRVECGDSASVDALWMQEDRETDPGERANAVSVENGDGRRRRSPTTEEAFLWERP
ncbi:hypothetical protein HPB50_003614 [Hyalomma asiaticum]|uniref:Uncharacterized protein n=1 Tax=Hyalomma asiaticum TaxID=266040 RepID=A0ACB7RM82_HYAAI|nr:hypothetical protein HPB50_003614 [Hyalomma asiaticum]